MLKNICTLFCSVMIHQIFLIKHNCSKLSSWLNFPQLKLGDSQEFHPSDIPQLSHPTSATLRPCFKFNWRWERVLWSLQKRGNLFLFIQLHKSTLQSKHPTQHRVSCLWTFFQINFRLILLQMHQLCSIYRV